MAEEPEPKKFLEPVNTSEKLDRLLVIVKMPGWIALICLAFITFLILIWALVGKITVVSTAEGIFFNPESVEIIQSHLKGSIAEIPYKQGDLVKAGDIILLLRDPEKKIELNQAQQQIKFLENKLAQEKKNHLEQATIELAKRRDIYNLQQQRLSEIRGKSGSEQTLYELEVAMKNQESAILLLEKQIASPESIPSPYDEKVQELQAKVNLMKQRLDALSIRAPADGRILSIQVVLGEEVDFGKSLLWFEKQEVAGTHALVYAFFPLEPNTPIKPGMQALIQFYAIDANIYGKMRGTVKNLRPFASSLKGEILETIPSMELRSYLTQNKASTVVVIEPEADPAATSGFAWTTPKGPPKPPVAGSVTKVEVITEERRPISYLIPIKGH